MSTHSNLQAASRKAAQSLADRDTPFLANCWYVAAFSSELAVDALKPRTLLGRPVVMFRDGEGRPHALDDRCPHRSFPLSRGRLEQGTITCGYHGLRYGADGRCVGIPGQSAAPKGIEVRSYPLLETGPIVWIWMGRSEPAPLPDGLDWIREESRWPASRGYFHLPASYIALHENLLDLTHLSFLHASSFGTPDYALAPYDVSLDEERGRFAVLRSVIPTRLPPVWGEPTGLSGRDAARITKSEFRSPAVHIVTASFHACDLPESERPDFRIATAHLVTPESPDSTHYFIHHGRNFGIHDAGITTFMHDQLFTAFREDVDGLTAVERSVKSTPPGDFYEFSIPSDRAGVAMRRWLRKAVLAESPSGPDRP